MSIWLVPIINAGLSLWLTIHTLRAKRLIGVFWALATYFGLLLLRDMWVAPIYYGKASGQGLVDAVVDANHISQIALSVLLCNLSFLIGQQITFRLVARPGPTLPDMDPTSTAAKFYFYFYLVLFVVGSVVYLPGALTSSYYENVNNLITPWPSLIFQLSTPVLTIAALQRRYIICLVGAVAGVSVVVATHVRELVLLAVLPTILVLLFRRSGTRKAVVVPFAVLFVGLGTYVEYIRSDVIELPDEFLPRGMYLISKQVDGGISGTGNTSLEITAKALVFPFYNRLLIPDYNMPADSATYTAKIMVAQPAVESGFQHYPFLWYTDVYLAAGRLGFWQGLVWGGIFGLWEGAMAGRVIVSAVYLPCFARSLYLFYRGAGAHVFHIVSRQLYFHLVVLLLGGLYLHRAFQRRKRTHTVRRAPLPSVLSGKYVYKGVRPSRE
ncbi:MAG TPA: hypothetical protein VN442_25320 [Bryobacteraceae bacterium]|nr:hypothetical protein [Bryobacteraceae bacterium]